MPLDYSDPTMFENLRDAIKYANKLVEGKKKEDLLWLFCVGDYTETEVEDGGISLDTWPVDDDNIYYIIVVEKVGAGKTFRQVSEALGFPLESITDEDRAILTEGFVLWKDPDIDSGGCDCDNKEDEDGEPDTEGEDDPSDGGKHWC